MLLENKIAIIYGGGGPIGGAIARAFAREGATVHLAARTLGKLEAVAEDIRAAGGTAETATLDALDEAAVDRHADAVAAGAGGIDISLNVIGYGDAQGLSLLDTSLSDFTQPITTAMTTQFLTGRAAARHMVKRGSGVIMMFGGSGAPMPNLGSIQVTYDAMEGLRRQWACELGPQGVRVVTLRTGGIPEAIPDVVDDAFREQIVDDMKAASLLNRTATLADVGNVAAFAASDRARTFTSTAFNISCGTYVD